MSDDILSRYRSGRSGKKRGKFPKLVPIRSGPTQVGYAFACKNLHYHAGELFDSASLRENSRKKSMTVIESEEKKKKKILAANRVFYLSTAA